MLNQRPWGTLGVLLFINIIAYIDRSLLLGFSPQVTQELSLSNTQFGFLSGAVWVMSYSVMAPVFGSLADRCSRTKVIACGVFIWSFCTALSGFAQSFEQLVLARFLVASGEAALVPAATSILTDVFHDRRRSTANGLFFMGLPLGIGLALVISGTIGAIVGWRVSFWALGVIGAIVALAVGMVQDRRAQAMPTLGPAIVQQVRAACQAVFSQPTLGLVILAFMLVHVVFVQSSFLQLWLVRERGADPVAIARQIGLMQIVFGCGGALFGGVAADRLARWTRSGLALLPLLLVVACVPMMVASRFSSLHSPLLMAGVAAGFFLPFAVYGSSLALIQSNVVPGLRATVMGLTMTCLNVIAIAIGTLLAGWVSDLLVKAGYAGPLTKILLGTDGIVAMSSVVYFMVMRRLTRDVPVGGRHCATLESTFLQDPGTQNIG